MEADNRQVDFLNGLEWCLPPAQVTATVEEATKPEQTQDIPIQKPTVGEIARQHGWKVGRKEVRVIGHGETPDHPVEVNGWLLMKAIQYEGIVPQEALDRVRVLVAEGVEIKGLLIADDLRSHKLMEFRRKSVLQIERVRAIDWHRVRTATVQGASALATTTSSTTAYISSRVKHKAEEVNTVWGEGLKRMRKAVWQNVRDATAQKATVLVSNISSASSSITGRIKQKTDEVDWEKVRTVSEKGFKVVAIATAGVAVAAVALPVIALVAVPFAMLSYDPLLIVVDSQNRFWLIAEWYD